MYKQPAERKKSHHFNTNIVWAIWCPHVAPAYFSSPCSSSPILVIKFIWFKGHYTISNFEDLRRETSGPVIRASCHVSRAGKVDTTRQEVFTDCRAGLGERRRRISSFTDIGEQSHWWTLAYLEGNYYVHFSYSFSPHPPGPHGRTIAPLSTVAPPANITGPTHMAGGPKS